MSQESQENWKLPTWEIVVGQMNSSEENWVSLDLMSYYFHHMKIISRENLLYMTLQTTFMLRPRSSFSWKIIFYVETL